MKLKKILVNLDGLSDEVAGLYEKKADGKFHLNVEDDDGAELRQAKEHEVGLRKIAEQERDAALAAVETEKAKVATLTNDAGKNVQQVRDQLKAEYEQKLADKDAAHSAKVTALEATVRKVFVSDVAHRIATELTDVPDLLLPLLEKRLSVEIVNGEPLTRVLAEDGKASAMTPTELQQEFLQNKKFERIIRGSGANGGGAGGGSGGGGASGKKLKDMSDAERAAWHGRDPEGFQRAVDADKKTIVV